jgi:phosphohistidine phosphatase
MKTLLLLRHGKSSWDEPVEDHDRPLQERGKRDAKRLGAVLRERGVLPELIVTSSAKRARGTAKRVAKAAKYDGDVVETPELYFTSVEHQLEVLASLDEAYQCAMVVGHNPNSEELVFALTGQRLTMPTAALACVDFEMDSWSALGSTGGTLRFQLIPKKDEVAQ